LEIGTLAKLPCVNPLLSAQKVNELTK